MKKEIVKTTVTGARVEPDKSGEHSNAFVIETTSDDVIAFWFDNGTFRTDWENGTFNPVQFLQERNGISVGDEILVTTGVSEKKHFSKIPTEQNIRDGYMFIAGNKISISELPQ